MSRWGNHPYSRGSYSGFLPVHGTGEEYDVMSCPVFEERVGKDGRKIQVLATSVGLMLSFCDVGPVIFVVLNCKT